MNIELLKRLLPGEVDEYLVRSQVRADGRELRDHRPIQLTRSVMGSHDATMDQADQSTKVSCAVKLGQTHVLCSLINQRQEGAVLSLGKPIVNISLILIKDQSLNIRRDLIEEKETQIKQSLKNKIDRCLRESPQIMTALANPSQLNFTF